MRFWLTTFPRRSSSLREATIDNDTPPADQDGEYRAKYHEHIARIGMTPETFAQRYNVPVRIQLSRLRGH